MSKETKISKVYVRDYFVNINLQFFFILFYFIFINYKYLLLIIYLFFYGTCKGVQLLTFTLKEVEEDGDYAWLTIALSF